MACELGMLFIFLKGCKNKNKKKGEECTIETVCGPQAKEGHWPSENRLLAC